MTAGILQDGISIPKQASPYSLTQARTYLDKLGWEADTAPEAFDTSLENLRRLMFLHTLAFPHDVSALHYTEAHAMPVTPEGMYQSMIVENRGSYCFGQNGLMLHMLRGLGYRALVVAGRSEFPVGPPHADGTQPMEYTGYQHLVILVQPHDEQPYAAVTYIVDVGYGGTGTIRPLLLEDGSAGAQQRTLDEASDGAQGGWIWGSYPPERHRVVRGTFYNGCLETGSLATRSWKVQVSHTSILPGDDHVAPSVPEWKTLYTFSEIEFYQPDIDGGSFSASGMTRYPFARAMICTRRLETSLLEESDKAEVAARGDAQSLRWVTKWTLEGAKVTHRVGRRVVEEREMHTELERIRVLRDVFAIGVQLEDEKWIRGKATALPA